MSEIDWFLLIGGICFIAFVIYLFCTTPNMELPRNKEEEKWLEKMRRRE